MISVIVSWRDRVELSKALPSMVSEVESVGGDITIVNFGGDPELLKQQVSVERKSVRLLSAGPRPFFNKPIAQNLGASQTTQPLLFFCDCDIIIPEGVLKAVASSVLGRSDCFGTFSGVRETERNSRQAKHITCFGYRLLLRTADGRELRIIDQEEDANDGARHAPGLLIVRREHFLFVNGYNGGLDGWGWEDQDMICRLTLGAGLTRISQGDVLHISHGDEARVGAYPYADRWESRDKMFRRALARYDNANFQGTFDIDVEGMNSSYHASKP
jgi:N-terminal domain of galactosyltransferase